MEFPTRDGMCKVCVKVVTARQHALECDGCGRWVHRLCGTGISYTQYRGIMENLRHGGSFPWRCQSCESEAIRSADKRDGDAEPITDNEVDLDIGAPTMESTRVDAPKCRYVIQLYH